MISKSNPPVDKSAPATTALILRYTDRQVRMCRIMFQWQRTNLEEYFIISSSMLRDTLINHRDSYVPR